MNTDASIPLHARRGGLRECEMLRDPSSRTRQPDASRLPREAIVPTRSAALVQIPSTMLHRDWSIDSYRTSYAAYRACMNAFSISSACAYVFIVNQKVDCKYPDLNAVREKYQCNYPAQYRKSDTGSCGANTREDLGCPARAQNEVILHPAFVRLR